MRKNVRVPVSFSDGRKADGQMSLAYPVAISLVCHMVFLALFVVTPSLRFDRPQPRSVISVSMVSMKKDASGTASSASADRKPPAAKKTADVKPATPPKPVKKTAKPVVNPSPTPPKPKTSLKHKTFKSTQVVKKAIEQLETKVAKTPAAPEAKAASPEDLKSALNRLRQEVGKVEAAKSAASAKGAGEGRGTSTGKAGATPGPFNEDGKRSAELIDLYRIEVAFQIQKNWAFNEQLAGGDRSLASAIVFKVMPNGEIRDIFFTDRSGNTYLDESGYKAIVKSNPVDPHPPGLNLPYVEMGIRFTPQGIR
ncbi:hypothetical protein DSCO28_22230 [Desulfosarcina ovata subsp. sediminis]|uniref:TonB C-terminal domain-containing protein n=1 Tax=Desulfosarcina ovata subsp. sediminis TaxID=885957 RepID=A0A5K7ZN37_9BACT|nr:TonB C-terminal domain-containing protein [Desulfosarcina ovata]BBO81657.1 hypothetical protein DSCO28_22230 [Desulfosarcina ovata subsp. sediminis]